MCHNRKNFINVGRIMGHSGLIIFVEKLALVLYGYYWSKGSQWPRKSTHYEINKCSIRRHHHKINNGMKNDVTLRTSTEQDDNEKNKRNRHKILSKQKSNHMDVPRGLSPWPLRGGPNL